jgi:predicted nucleotidyltransferase
MEKRRDYIPKILERLKEINPSKVILFGSYAYGTPHEDSDIDLIIVLNKRGVAASYKEKKENRMTVGKKIFSVEEEAPIDTLVYTLDEWEYFLNNNSSFSKLITQKGILLYEADNRTMA